MKNDELNIPCEQCGIRAGCEFREAGTVCQRCWEKISRSGGGRSGSEKTGVLGLISRLCARMTASR